jgi:hypothetical protein
VYFILLFSKMATISNEEFEQLMNIWPESEIFTVAAARLYNAYDGFWQFTGIEGVAAVLSEGPSYYIRVASLDVSNVRNFSKMG